MPQNFHCLKTLDILAASQHKDIKYLPIYHILNLIKLFSYLMMGVITLNELSTWLNGKISAC